MSDSFTRFDEHHYSTAEVAGMWNIDAKTVRKLFEKEEGVLRIGHKGNRTRRAYQMLRFPQSVVERVHRKLRTT